MKKLAQLFTVAGLLVFIACGPSVDQNAVKAKLLDSLKKDSIAKVEKLKAEAAELKAKATADSIAEADKAKVNKSKSKKVKSLF